MGDMELGTTSKKKRSQVDKPKRSDKKKANSAAGQTRVPPPLLRGEPGSGHKKSDVVGELQALFKEMDLPEKIVPNNVKSYHYNRSSGQIVIHLRSGFEKAFDKENVIKFDNRIEGRPKPGEFTQIKGVSRGSASIVSMKRGKPGFIDITGKLGFFSKTLTFADTALPDLP